MPPHRDRNVYAGLPVKALYTFKELAEAVDFPPGKLRRLAKLSGVELVRSGRAMFVPLSEIEEKIPRLWKSILAAERARHPASR